MVEADGQLTELFHGITRTGSGVGGDEVARLLENAHDIMKPGGNVGFSGVGIIKKEKRFQGVTSFSAEWKGFDGQEYPMRLLYCIIPKKQQGKMNF